LRRGVRWWLEAALCTRAVGRRQASPDDLQPFTQHSAMTASEQGSQVPSPYSETSPIIVPNTHRPHHKIAGPHSKRPTTSAKQGGRTGTIAVSTSAVSRGQTSWLSRPWTGIYQSAALLPLRTTCLCDERLGWSVAQYLLWPLSKFHALRSSPKLPHPPVPQR
jgi:hypothetical protein